MGRILLIFLVFIFACKKEKENGDEATTNHDGDFRDIEEEKGDPQNIPGKIPGKDPTCMSYDSIRYQNVCAEIVKNQKATSIPVKNFIEWISSLSVRSQGFTHFPASVMAAQLIIETGWGKSNNLKSGNSLAGHSCFKKDRVFTFQLPFLTKPVEANCDRPRPKAEGSFYLSFKSIEDSADAYIYNLLYAKNNFYEDLRDEVNRAIAHQEPSGNSHTVSNGLTRYAAIGDEYVKLIQKVVKAHSLILLDSRKICQ